MEVIKKLLINKKEGEALLDRRRKKGFCFFDVVYNVIDKYISIVFFKLL